MGNCLKLSKKQPSNSMHIYSPARHSASSSMNSSTFQVRLRNFKLTMNQLEKSLKAVTLHGSICGTPFQIKSSLKDESGFVFNAVEQFSLKLSYVDVVESLLEISVVNGHNNKEIGVARITLKSIVEGPVKQNFPVLWERERKGRVKFICEILEETKVKVALEALECTFESPKPGPWKAGFQVVSDGTYKSQDMPLAEEPRWEFKNEYPTIDFPASIASVRDTNIKIKIWHHENGQNVKIGELWLHLPLLLNEETQDSIENIRSYSKDFHEIILHHGKRTGTVMGSFFISNLPPVLQMTSGVNTETGLQLSSPSIIKPKKAFGSSLPSEMKKIIDLTASITKSIETSERAKYSLNYKNQIYNRKKNMEKVLLLLQEKHHETNFVFLYSDTSDLTKAQKALMDLAEYLIDQSDFMPFDSKALAFRCLYNIFRRGELDLAFLSFKEEDTEKQTVAERFRSIFYMALKLALSRMSYKGLDDYTIEFTDFILAVSWFRVPYFREIMTKKLKEKSYPEIPPDYLYHLNLAEGHSTIVPGIDWDGLFHQHLPPFAYSLDFLKNEIWQDRLAQRSIAFFEFISYWVELLVKLMPANIVWEGVPEYSVLIKCFIIEMLERNVKGYPEAMVEAGSKLLANKDLLNPFVRVLLTKTNLYDYRSVHESFNILNRWFFSVVHYNKAIHYTFDWDLLIQGLKLILQSDLGLNVASGLLFIYNHHHHIRGNQRKQLIQSFLIKKMFFKLMHHWSVQVRNLFICYLLYRILSMEFLNFEAPDDFLYLNEEIHQTVERNIKKALKMKEKPYQLHAIKEYEEKYQKFSEWKSLLPPNTIGHSLNQYGVFTEFPYPKHDIGILEDLDDFEKEEETWS